MSKCSGARISDVWQLIILSILTIVGAALRIPRLQTGLTRDEASSVFVAQAPHFTEFMNRLYTIEFSPPAYFAILHGFLKTFGTDETVVQLPTLIASLLLIPATYALARTCSDERVAIVASLFATVSAQSIYFSHEARAYAPAALAEALATTFLILSMRHKERRSLYLSLFTLFSTLFFYVHYTALFYMAALTIAFLYLWWRKEPDLPVKPYVKAAVACLLLMAPWLPTLIRQVQTGVPGHDRVPLVKWPMVFFFNIQSMIPLPFVPAVIFLSIVVFAVAVWALATLLRRKQRLHVVNALSPRRLSSDKIVLVACVIVPASILGYVGQWYFSYYRYIFPFSSTAWTLESLIAAAILASPPLGKRWLKVTVGSIAIVSIVFANCYFARQDLSRPKSGLKTFALEVFSGAWKDAVLVVAPDPDAQTFVFYYETMAAQGRHGKRGQSSAAIEKSDEPRKADTPDKPEQFEMHGFARWDSWTPFLPEGYDAIWQEKDLIDKTMDKIDMLAQRYGRLAFAIDTYFGDFSEVKARTLSERMAEEIGRRYKLAETRTYDGTREKFNVYIFDLKDRKSER